MSKLWIERNLENSYICELTSIPGKYKVNNTIMVPIKKPSGKVVAVLEVNKSIIVSLIDWIDKQ